ncbi:hypothetical protein EV647_4886 [Kribbella sp. VKM Ac-2566]|nr:hypothetical protein EV647_4886 [Kribbella sp. VKM Ac-2566]
MRSTTTSFPADAIPTTGNLEVLEHPRWNVPLAEGTLLLCVCRERAAEVRGVCGYSTTKPVIVPTPVGPLEVPLSTPWPAIPA